MGTGPAPSGSGSVSGPVKWKWGGSLGRGNSNSARLLADLGERREPVDRVDPRRQAPGPPSRSAMSRVRGVRTRRRIAQQSRSSADRQRRPRGEPGRGRRRDAVLDVEHDRVGDADIGHPQVVGHGRPAGDPWSIRSRSTPTDRKASGASRRTMWPNRIIVPTLYKTAAAPRSRPSLAYIASTEPGGKSLTPIGRNSSPEARTAGSTSGGLATTTRWPRRTNSRPANSSG